jgi:hypothetical protein
MTLTLSLSPKALQKTRCTAAVAARDEEEEPALLVASVSAETVRTG